jgi:hypothetical protein
MDTTMRQAGDGSAMTQPPRGTVVPERGHYQYRTVTIPATISPADARRMLTDEAEYGRWELARVRLYFGGVREATLRRRVIRVPSTLDL